MNKKGISMAFVMAAIILLLLTFVFLQFYYTVFGKAKESIPERQCQISVQREAKLNTQLKLLDSGHTVKDFASNVECEQIPITISQKKPETAGLITKKYLDKCWTTFGSGRLELFSRGSGTFCHICYITTYDPVLTFSLPKKEKHYDVPQELSSEKLAVVFYYNKKGETAEQKVFLRPPDKLQMCERAEFPVQRRK